jgi:hypothetical protein
MPVPPNAAHFFPTQYFKLNCHSARKNWFQNQDARILSQDARLSAI